MILLVLYDACVCGRIRLAERNLLLYDQLELCYVVGFISSVLRCCSVCLLVHCGDMMVIHTNNHCAMLFVWT